MATRDAVEITHLASCPNSTHPEDEVCNCIKPEFDIAVAAKPNLSLPSTPSTGSTRSKRSIWSDDEGSSSDSEHSEHVHKRVKTGSLSPFLPRTRSFEDSSDVFLHLPRNLYVDKSKCVMDFPDKFQYLVLRPPQFGKTMLISMLYHFYDIHGANQFAERFGSLAVVTKASTPVRHSQHLCLSFNLLDFWVCSDRTDLVSDLPNQISHVLDSFLIKYAKELKLSPLEDYPRDEGLAVKFAKTFDLVKACGYSLFVGVDNYDAPTRRLTPAARGDFRYIPEGSATPREVQRLLDSCFWNPLMAATDVIDKLCITGALLVDYSTLESLGSVAIPGLDSVCGFTEEEALYFTRSLLDETPNISDLRRLCGDYAFSSSVAGGTAQFLLHPRLVINRIFELSLPHPPIDQDSFELLSDILEGLPEESDVPGAVTLNDLIHLLATGAVDIDGKKPSPFDLAATKAVTWGTLHSAGALTYDRRSGDTLRVASSQALSLIHSRVDDFFCDRHELGVTFTTAWYHFGIASDPEPLLELLLEVLHDLARRSFDKKHEPNLHGIFELIMRNSRCRARRNVDPIILLPTESPCIQVPAYQSETDVTFELYTLTLRGMWQAVHPNDDEPTVEALKALHEELVALEEDELLARPYATWSPTLNAVETVLVGSFFDSDFPEIPRFLAVGGAHVLLRQRLPEDSAQEDSEEEED